jgi:hypothetical protein
MSADGAAWQWPEEMKRESAQPEHVYPAHSSAESSEVPNFKANEEQMRDFMPFPSESNKTPRFKSEQEEISRFVPFPAESEQRIFETQEQTLPGFVPFPKESAPEPQETDEPSSELPESRAHYPSRQCRICLEEVEPSFEPVEEGITAFLNPKPKVEYISSDPESGRLIRPCKCRGSQQYVHEGCLQEWRHADPQYGQRNYFQCPTCKFQYRLERMKWSRLIQNPLLQLGVTAFIMLITIFILGFVADPIINLYFEPVSTIGSIATGHGVGHLDYEEDLDEYDGWILHFVKGLTSIGVLGFVKVLFTLNPFSWWNLRQTGLGSGRNRRDRNDGNFTFFIIVGIVAFLFVSSPIVCKYDKHR